MDRDSLIAGGRHLSHARAQQVHGGGQCALAAHVQVPGQAGELPFGHHSQFCGKQ